MTTPRKTFFVEKITRLNGTTQFNVVRKILDVTCSSGYRYNEVKGYNVYTEDACRKLADRLEGELVVSTEYL